MEETKGKRIIYNPQGKCLQLENGEVLSLRRACQYSMLEEEYMSQENLDELAKMFPDFNEFQFSVFCTLLVPKFMNYTAEAKGSELMKIPTREEFSDKQRLMSLQKLFYWGIIYSTYPSQDITQDYLKITDDITTKLHKVGAEPFKVKCDSSIFDIILPGDIREETLFYNSDVLKSLEEIKFYLQPDNFRKLQEHFKKEERNLSFVCLLEGPSGTGKTAFVRELARVTGRPILFTDIARIRSKEYGHDERMTRMLFDDYLYWSMVMPLQPILFVDECDTILTSRQNPDGNANSSLVNCQNTVTEIWLQELDKFEGISFLTTNNADHMDEAIARRLTFQIHIGHPEPEIQVRLWQHFFPSMDETEAKEMAKETNFTGGQMLSVKRKVMFREILSGPVSLNELKRYCSTNGKIQKRNPVGFGR